MCGEAASDLGGMGGFLKTGEEGGEGFAGSSLGRGKERLGLVGGGGLVSFSGS